MNELVLVGISHRVAPVEVRERVALSDRQADRIVTALCGEPLQQSRAMEAFRCQEAQPRIGDRAHHSAPQLQCGIGQFAGIVQAAECHIATLEGRQRIDLRLIGQRVIAPE